MTAERNRGLISPALLPFVEEQQRVNDGIRRAGQALPPPDQIDPVMLRRSRSHNRDGSIRPPLDRIGRDAQLVLADGRTIAARVFAEGETEGIFVHFHGGGWALGSLYEQDSYLAGIARAARVKVMSVDYPLAPEHRLPEILEVAAASLRAIVAGHRDQPICVGGESAGGHVALVSLLRLRAEPDLFAAIKGAALCYPITDLSMTPSQRSWGSDFLNLSTPWLEFFYALALPGMSQDARSHPDLSPLYASLAEFPPTLLCVGALDPLLDDALFLERRLLAADAECRLEVFPEAPHGFNGQPTQMAAACNRLVQTFIKARLRGRPLDADPLRP